MEPAEETRAEKPLPRRKAWVAAGQARAHRLAARADEERRKHRSLDAVFEMADRDNEVAGGIIAGALAYRLFIWLLPLALVLVAGLGIAADTASESPEEAAKDVGLAGLISDSIASAANSSTRWYALLIGVPVLLYATRSFLRTLIAAHRLVWSDVRAAAPKPTLAATVRLLGLMLAIGLVTALAVSVRSWSGIAGLLGSAVIAIPYAGLWWLISLRLPRRDAPALALLPGALLFGVGSEVLHSVVVYVIQPYAVSKQGTYGALGVAATLLFGMFLLCRMVVATAVLNATLWDRRGRDG